MGLLKQVAAVQGKAAEHASTPSMDGVDGCLVHALRGQMQVRCTLRPLFWRECLGQVVQKGVWLAGTSRHLGIKPQRGFVQSKTDSLPQFSGSGIGEGHHQNMGGQQAFCITPMTQNQTHIQRCQGEGFSRTCTGFDDLPPRQGQREQVQAHAFTPSLGSAPSGKAASLAKGIRACNIGP